MLTTSQDKILNAIKFYYRMFGFSPSVRDIADLCGMKSINTVRQHLQTLKQKGLISMEESKARAIKILS
ncbi:repressor LexA [Anaerosolibacter carboniphilus]|uniref:Repressor LexA n=1 Tax=Anaerosolibacter carboniphilus TaxID=1417629 RepID=A0A841KU75_9FIRM|nr:helix-turn-helix domain-containing protein [Anaerosolibacter carboniphilus]MBB6217156.1 repressor LexA [Anaerosolibacter carboniphilus]